MRGSATGTCSTAHGAAGGSRLSPPSRRGCGCPWQQHRHPAGLAGKRLAALAQGSFERLMEFKWKRLERR